MVAVLGVGVVDPAAPVVRADDPGVTRGDGCFEGCRLRDGVIDKLDAHLARLARSAAALEIPFDRQTWMALIEDAVAAWPDPGEAAVKVLLTRGAPGAGPGGFVAIGPLPADYPRQRRDGIKAVTLSRGFDADAFAAAPWLLGGVKTLSYAVNMAAQREAARRGADDVVFVSADGRVLEAPTSSVVWWAGATLHTPPTGDTGILAGTTQQLLFERAAVAGWRTAETLAGVADLHAAEAIWLIGSVRGPVDIVELDGVTRARLPDIDAEIRRLAGF
ncbi:MAG: 4-amino-4-deoxychorismate lyase [Pseudonocardiales bacterium]|nr:4-amino-4-deoxychorismate lyase [Pseudonocardiales bacterium]